MDLVSLSFLYTIICSLVAFLALPSLVSPTYLSCPRRHSSRTRRVSLKSDGSFEISPFLPCGTKWNPRRIPRRAAPNNGSLARKFKPSRIILGCHDLRPKSGFLELCAFASAFLASFLLCVVAIPCTICVFGTILLLILRALGEIPLITRLVDGWRRCWFFVGSSVEVLLLSFCWLVGEELGISWFLLSVGWCYRCLFLYTTTIFGAVVACSVFVVVGLSLLTRCSHFLSIFNVDCCVFRSFILM